MSDAGKQKLHEWFLGDDDAVDYALQMWKAWQDWDDLVDNGKIEDPSALLNFFAHDLDLHPFYARWRHILQPIMRDCYQSWAIANELEAPGDELIDEADREKAYMLRAAPYRLFVQIATCCGGTAHGIAVGPDIWRTYGERVSNFLTLPDNWEGEACRDQ